MFSSGPKLVHSETLREEDAALHIDGHLRELVCLTEDKRLLVLAAQRHIVGIRAFVMRVQRKTPSIKVEYVDGAKLAQAQSATRALTNVRSASDAEAHILALFKRAVQEHASDIHFRVSRERGATIRFRIHGDLSVVEEVPFDEGHQICAAIYQSMCDVADSTFEPLSRQDARISDRARIPEGLDGIRVGTSPQVGGFVMVLRLLYNDAVGGGEGLEGLGFGAQQRAAIDILVRRPTGVVVIGGPTGSGKSTTLQRLLAKLIKDSEGRKAVYTVEDPPEYPIEGAVQTPVTNADTEEERAKAFQKAIKATMRLDPDVGMIGEIRDGPSANLAVEFGMTGHKVWTTTHVNNAFAIMDRMVDLGVPKSLVTDPTVVTGLMCQRLLRVLCPNCKRPLSKALDKYRESDVRRVLSKLDLDNIYVHGDGCPKCRGTGSVGRTVVAEVVVAEPELMRLLREDQREAAIELWRRTQSGVTMLEDAVTKIGTGTVDPFQAEEIVGPLDAGEGNVVFTAQIEEVPHE